MQTSRNGYFFSVCVLPCWLFVFIDGSLVICTRLENFEGTKANERSLSNRLREGTGLDEERDRPPV